MRARKETMSECLFAALFATRAAGGANPSAAAEIGFDPGLEAERTGSECLFAALFANRK